MDNIPRTTMRRLRYKAGLSQADLARVVGLSRQSIHRIEKGLDLPEPKNARAIADALGAEPEDFLQELAA